MSSPPHYAPSPDRWSPFGRLGRPHGVRGEVPLTLFNPDSENATGLVEVRLRKGDQTRILRVLRSRPHADKLLLLLEDITDRESAAAIAGWQVEVRRSAWAALGPDEWYIDDLKGCQLATPAGLVLGLVLEVLAYAHGAYLLVDVSNAPGARAASQHEQGNQRGLLEVPLAADWVLEVNLDQRRILATLPEGMMELVQWTSK